jgi:electron transport complex protein RnfA
MNHLLSIIIGAIFVNNFVLYRFLGICPFIGVSRSTRPAIGMGLAVTAVMGLASAITWPLYHYVLLPFDMEFMYIVVFILVIASFVQFLEIFLKRYNQSLFQALGIYLPLITTNCAIMGVALLNISDGLTWLESFVFGVSAGLGFLMALILMSGIRERLELGDVPKPFQGVSIAFITAAMLSMAFLIFGTIAL